MDIATRNRKYRQGKTYVKTSTRLPIKFDISALDLMCQYILSDNRNIKRGSYINLRNLVELLDPEMYNGEQELSKRLTFIKKGLKGKLEDNISDPSLLIKYINGGFLDSNLLELGEIKPLSNGEIDWINETVSNTLSLTFLYEEADRGLDIITRFKAADSSNISVVGEEFKEWVMKLNTAFRKVKSESVTTETFSLGDGVLKNKLHEIRTELTSTYRKLLTGMQGVNQLLGGGFENTRCYLFLGITGVGKSLTLLDLAYQVKKYNKTFRAKDPTKIPCIVYLTQENTVTESVDRLFKMATAEDLRNVDVDDAVNIMRATGELYLSDDSPIDIIVKYQPNRSVDTSYLYTLTEDLEDEGYEVIMMIQDHVKRIRSVEGNQDIRIELGDVINEMKTFAILKDMPIITISHLNREGARVIDASGGKSKSDLTRMLGKSNIGESMLMLDNVDYGCILNKAPDPDYPDRDYMAFKTIKKRFAAPKEFIYQPYNQENTLKLIEDFYSPVPLFRETLEMTAIGVNNNNMQAQQSKVVNTGYAASIPVYDEPDEDNIFEFAAKEKSKSTYSSESMKREPIQLLTPVSEAG